MVDALEIGYAIKRRREALGLTQAQVSDRSGVSKRCLWAMELGQSPGVQLDKLTAVLGVLGLNLVIEGAYSVPVHPVGKAGTDVSGILEPRPEAVEALNILRGGVHER